jgi:hypothetical protein
MHGELPGWGTAQWGFAKFGLNETTGGPLVIYKYPESEQLEVAEDTFITVQFFDPTYNLNTATVAITINGVLAYVGATGFSAGYLGKVSYAGGVLTVRIRYVAGFTFEQTVSMSAYVQDLTDLSVTANWTFKIRANPVCYTGLKPLPVEVALQSSFTRFISLEPYRTLFLDNALRSQPASVASSASKAARALYQAAFSTELCTLQNPYDLRNKDALESVVCEKQNTRSIDQALTASSKNLKADIQAFHKLSGLDAAYLTAFNDYLDSTLYLYRVSLVANVLLFAKAYELAQDS